MLVAQSTVTQIDLSDGYHLKTLSAPVGSNQPGLMYAHRDYPEFDAKEVRTWVESTANRESPLYENLKAADFVVRFPNGLSPIGNLVQASGLRFLAWFEPERAMKGTRMHRAHPEWLRIPAGKPAV